MYSVVANYVCMSNFQLCYSPSTYLQISAANLCTSLWCQKSPEASQITSYEQTPNRSMQIE